MKKNSDPKFIMSDLHNLLHYITLSICPNAAADFVLVFISLLCPQEMFAGDYFSFCLITSSNLQVLEWGVISAEKKMYVLRIIKNK